MLKTIKKICLGALLCSSVALEAPYKISRAPSEIVHVYFEVALERTKRDTHLKFSHYFQNTAEGLVVCWNPLNERTCTSGSLMLDFGCLEGACKPYVLKREIVGDVLYEKISETVAAIKKHMQAMKIERLVAKARRVAAELAVKASVSTKRVTFADEESGEE